MTEARFSFTTKINGDLLTVRGDSIEEFDNNIGELATSLQGVTDLQEAVRAVGVVAAAVSDQPAQAALATHYDAAPAAPAGEVETLPDRYGNQWTYNLPDAPDLPDGRGKYALKAGTSKAGKPYKIFSDPAKGPKPFPKGAFEAEAIWPKR